MWTLLIKIMPYIVITQMKKNNTYYAVSWANYSREVSLLIPWYVTEKTPVQQQEFFLFLSCIRYALLVNIMSLSGTHTKREPSWEKGSGWDLVSSLCSFLYIVDMTAFLIMMNDLKMNKKCTFYSYATPHKKIPSIVDRIGCFLLLVYYKGSIPIPGGCFLFC